MADLTPAQQALLDEAKDAEKKEESKDESKDDTSEEKSADQPYQGKFKQFKTVTELETSFANSFTEAQRLNEKIKALEEEKASLTPKGEEPKSQDEDKVKTLEDKIGQLEARLSGQEDKQKSEDERQFNQWMEKHPDLKDNDPLVQDLLEELGFVAQKAAKRKEFLSMSEGLDRAWQRVSPGEPSDDGELEGAKKQAQKDLASSPAPSGSGRTDAKKTVLTTDQKRTAKTYGFSDEQYIEFLNKE